MRKVIFVYQKAPQEIITGGHLYEDKLAKGIAALADTEVTILSAPAANNLIAKILAPLRNLTLLRPLLHGSKPTVVFNSSKFLYFLPLAAVLRVKGIPTVAVHHHFLYNEVSGIRRPVYTIGEKIFLRLCRYIIAPSRFMRREITRIIGRKPAYIPTPCPENRSGCTSEYNRILESVNTHEYRPIIKPVSPPEGDIDTSGSLHSDLTANRVVKLLFTGTVEPRKGLIYAIKALDILNRKGIPFIFDIVGKCVNKDYLYRLKEEIAGYDLNDKIHFHGFVTREELKRFYSTADIYLFPSMQEGFGLSIAEAMGYGLPVTGFDNSAMPYIVNTGHNGILVPTADHARLAEAIIAIATNPDLHRTLSANALTTAAHLPRHTDFHRALTHLFTNI